MACIRKRRGKYTLDYYDQHGTRRWETTDGNKKEAELLLAQRLHEVDRGEYQARGDQTLFEELVDSYVENVKVDVRDITAVEYEDDVRRHVLPFFKGRRVRSLTVRDVEDFRKYLFERGAAGVPIAGREGKVR